MSAITYHGLLYGARMRGYRLMREDSQRNAKRWSECD